MSGTDHDTDGQMLDGVILPRDWLLLACRNIKFAWQAKDLRIPLCKIVILVNIYGF